MPFVLLCAYWQTSKPPLLLIKGGQEKQRIRLINFKMRHGPFKWIKKIDVGFKHKLSLKFAYDAKGKLFLVLLISSICIILVYLSFNLFATNNIMVSSINNQFFANGVYGFSNQNVQSSKNDSENSAYDFLDKSTFDPNLVDQKLSTPFFGKQFKENVHRISSMIELLSTKNLRNTWMKAQLLVNEWEKLPDQVKKMLSAYQDALHVLAKNDGIFTFGFELYNSKIEQLMLNRPLGVYELAGKKASSITIFTKKMIIGLTVPCLTIYIKIKCC